MLQTKRYVGEDGYSNFPLLYKEGDEGEQLTAAWLHGRNNTEITHIDEAMKTDPTLKRSDWDLRLRNKYGNILYIEVKTQNHCHEPHYKHVNVEETQSGLDSGIRISKSDYYIFVNPVLGFGQVESAVLKRIEDLPLDRMEYPDFSTGAENVATGYLFPKNRLEWLK